MTNTSDSGQLRIGIVGIGSLGQRLAKQFRELEGATIRAVSDVDEEKLRTFGESISIPAAHQYTDYERMLSAEPLDAVGIATPNGLHYQQVMAALDAHLHVLCEKPLATTVEDAVALTERAERSDRTVMIGYQRHLNPAFELARDQWATGDRQARFITGEITHDWRSYFETMENWRMDPDLSGG